MKNNHEGILLSKVVGLSLITLTKKLTISFLFFKDFIKIARIPFSQNTHRQLYIKKRQFKNEINFLCFCWHKNYKTYFARMFLIVPVLYLEDRELLIICPKWVNKIKIKTKNWSLQRCELKNDQALIGTKINNDMSSLSVSSLGTQIKALIKRKVVKMSMIALLTEEQPAVSLVTTSIYKISLLAGFWIWISEM